MALEPECCIRGFFCTVTIVVGLVRLVEDREFLEWLPKKSSTGGGEAASAGAGACIRVGGKVEGNADADAGAGADLCEDDSDDVDGAEVDDGLEE